MTTDITFHYPPERMNLLIDTIPLLNRSKQDVFLFFQGAGVAKTLMRQPQLQWKRDRSSITVETTRVISPAADYPWHPTEFY